MSPLFFPTRWANKFNFERIRAADEDKCSHQDYEIVKGDTFFDSDASFQILVGVEAE